MMTLHRSIIFAVTRSRVIRALRSTLRMLRNHLRQSRNPEELPNLEQSYVAQQTMRRSALHNLAEIQMCLGYRLRFSTVRLNFFSDRRHNLEVEDQTLPRDRRFLNVPWASRLPCRLSNRLFRVLLRYRKLIMVELRNMLTIMLVAIVSPSHKISAEMESKCRDPSYRFLGLSILTKRAAPQCGASRDTLISIHIRICLRNFQLMPNTGSMFISSIASRSSEASDNGTSLPHSSSRVRIFSNGTPNPRYTTNHHSSKKIPPIHRTLSMVS